jgi:hypothetical protein
LNWLVGQSRDPIGSYLILNTLMLATSFAFSAGGDDASMGEIAEIWRPDPSLQRRSMCVWTDYSGTGVIRASKMSAFVMLISSVADGRDQLRMCRSSCSDRIGNRNVLEVVVCTPSPAAPKD